MRRSAFLALALLAAGDLFAVRHVGYESEAFCQVLDANKEKSFVFSPLSFELDCFLVAESLDTIPKANVSETMGTTFGFESAYRPIREMLVSWTNGMSFVAARGFCVPDLGKARPDHRQYLQQEYDAEVMAVHPRKGAETWFRAAMDGEMESFEIAAEGLERDRYSFFDLVSFRFACPTGVCQVVTVDRPDYLMVRFPLQDECDFLGFLPKGDEGLTRICEDLSAVEIDETLAVTKSVTAKGVSVGPAEVSLPSLSVTSQSDLLPLTRFFRIPTTGLTKVTDNLPIRLCTQWARLELAGGTTKAAEGPAAKRIVFDRPFVFLVYHEETRTFPMAGYLTGERK